MIFFPFQTQALVQILPNTILHDYILDPGQRQKANFSVIAVSASLPPQRMPFFMTEQ